MGFWDRFIRALSFGLAQRHPTGRDAALRLFALAMDRGRLRLEGLADGSLLLLLALLPGSDPRRSELSALAAQRGCLGNPVNVLWLLLGNVPARVTETVELGRADDPVTREASRQALFAPNRLRVVETLGLYIARHRLINPALVQLRQIVLDFLDLALERYRRVEVGTLDFVAFAY